MSWPACRLHHPRPGVLGHSLLLPCAHATPQGSPVLPGPLRSRPVSTSACSLPQPSLPSEPPPPGNPPEELRRACSWQATGKPPSPPRLHGGSGMEPLCPQARRQRGDRRNAPWGDGWLGGPCPRGAPRPRPQPRCWPSSPCVTPHPQHRGWSWGGREPVGWPGAVPDLGADPALEPALVGAPQTLPPWVAQLFREETRASPWSGEVREGCLPSPGWGLAPGSLTAHCRGEEAPGSAPKPVASCLAAHKALKAGGSWDIKGPGKLIVLN